MAFGFSAKHSQELRLENLNSEQFLVMSIEAAKRLDWEVIHLCEDGFIANTRFSLSSWGEKVTVKIESGKAILTSECAGKQILDWGKNKENIDQLIKQVVQLKNTITPDEVFIKLAEIKSNFSATEIDIVSTTPVAKRNKIITFFSFFKPTDGFFITPILVYINIAIFIVMVIAGVNFFFPDGLSVLKWGANLRPKTVEGEWWRLFTSFFLHFGIIHLVMNMYALILIGILLEPYLGKLKFATVYILSGLFASLTSIWWNDCIISAGASGAIFGLYGVFIAMLTTNLIDKTARNAMLGSIAYFVIYNLINGMRPNIDNAAHIGGLIGGIIIGYSYIPSLRRDEERNYETVTVGVLVITFSIFTFVVCKELPSNKEKFETKLNQYNTELNKDNLNKGIHKYMKSNEPQLRKYATATDFSKKQAKYETPIFRFADSKDLPENPSYYDVQMKKFAASEAMALEFYSSQSYVSKKEKLYGLNERGIYYWKENINLINDIEEIILPDDVHKKNKKLKQYCEFRIKCYELMTRAISENSEKYKNQIDNYNKQIEVIIIELNSDKQ